ncbi:MAG: hypothetical protein ACXWBP_11395 [Limisphaerales bacterium]
MSDQQIPPVSNPQSAPPLLSGSTPPHSNPPLGENPSDRQPVTGIVSAIEAILRQPRRIHYQLSQGKTAGIISVLLAIAVFCALVYGLIVGTFSGGMQLWAAPVKVAGGLLVSGLICLPSLYIFCCLSGSQARLGEVFGLLAGMLAITTILLIGFAPVAWVFSQSTESVPTMGTLHLLFWLVATVFGLRFLARGFSQLKAGTNGMLVLWSAIFLLVALQMTTALRPIVGKSDHFFPETKQFFLSHWAESLGLTKSD